MNGTARTSVPGRPSVAVTPQTRQTVRAGVAGGFVPVPGPPGPPGPAGPPGLGLAGIEGTLSDVAELPVPGGFAGRAFIVGGDLWIWRE